MEFKRFDICTCRDLIDWCRMKVEHEKFFHRSGNYCQGYEAAMNAVMSKLSDLEHKEKENKARLEREAKEKAQITTICGGTMYVKNDKGIWEYLCEVGEGIPDITEEEKR